MSWPRARMILAGLLVLAALGTGVSERPVGADPSPRLRTLEEARARARAVEADLVSAVRRVRASSVTVLGRRGARPARGGRAAAPPPVTSVGSGVLVAWQGTWVVTSLHVVEGEPILEAVSVDGRRHALRIRAASRPSDLALLAFVTPPTGLTAASLSSGVAEDVQEGTWVVATGNPFFLALDGRQAASLGVLSGIRPPDPAAYLDAPTIQHDAEINPGSSGGALWNRRGELVGINGTIATRSHRQGSGPVHTGASFSVPVAMIRRLLESALGAEAGPARRPSSSSPPAAPAVPPAAAAPPPRVGGLGVEFFDARDGSGHPYGAAVRTVARGSPAAPAGGRVGLVPGDVVTLLTIGGRMHRIRSVAELRAALGGSPPGTPLVLHYQRGGRGLAWSGVLGGS